MSDQIKRATRQIRQKENNLHQDLICEQRRRYDAETEQDNEIIRRQLAEGGIDRVVGDLQQLRTNAQNQVNRMLVIITRRQVRIGELLREKFVFQLVIRQRDQNILNLQAQILALQNNPLNMAEGRRLPVLKLMAPALAKFQPYIGQEPPDDYLDKVIQSWAYLEGHMAVLETANAGDFDNVVKCNILKSMMGGKYAPVPVNNGLVAGNLAINSPDTL
ncbi:hypothetical protein GLOIN_2v1778214 [Rhizophagus clarus]|uniref:Uncharacterized protein n=1 Tax=Rhizophagus clarus TaxID=94130 RepID=A0A8H3LNQ1_9GLOM|nr:hypothetical protein GLOIN_2v1778214 [Rhizophagus clarus]